MRDIVAQIKPPRFAEVLERQVAPIAERDVRQPERRILGQNPSPVYLAKVPAQTLLRIAVHHVPHMAGADENVLPPIQIDV